MNDKKKQQDAILSELTGSEYKYGFSSDIEMEQFPKGLNEDIIRRISAVRNEPAWVLDFRLKAFAAWQKMEKPEWAHLTIPEIDFQELIYYSKPKPKKKLDSLDEVDPEILEVYNKLGIPLEEQKALSGVAVDAVFDSVSVKTTFREELQKHGIIFCPIS